MSPDQRVGDDLSHSHPYLCPGHPGCYLLRRVGLHVSHYGGNDDDDGDGGDKTDHVSTVVALPPCFHFPRHRRRFLNPGMDGVGETSLAEEWAC